MANSIIRLNPWVSLYAMRIQDESNIGSRNEVNAKDYIFRIGAADAYGWSDKLTEDHRIIDYFLPGNQVADDVNPRLNLAEKLKYRDGSSIATVFADGLASLLLYLVNLVKIYHTGNAQRLKKMS
ncbi:intracellular serine protease [Colletotrichum abscissum]|uniref:Intracellular serine protease n=1 Tax=Colletotrichum abscissum TaxID=1671311 RepID=A0A9Q0B346_9PEZI|nr:intracellular serine protease [Colletotrichum abscissum]